MIQKDILFECPFCGKIQTKKGNEEVNRLAQKMLPDCITKQFVVYGKCDSCGHELTVSMNVSVMR